MLSLFAHHMNVPLLAGKTALITGASRGIGLGICHLLAKNRVSCILVGRNAETLDAKLAELPSGGHSRFAGDVASIDTWAKFENENVCRCLTLSNNGRLPG